MKPLITSCFAFVLPPYFKTPWSQAVRCLRHHGVVEHLVTSSLPYGVHEWMRINYQKLCKLKRQLPGPLIKYV